jgi:hypothetical protein
MTSTELRQLIAKPEDTRLEFKRLLKVSGSPAKGSAKEKPNQLTKNEWDEFIKDILALANGGVGTWQVPGRLIIGVDNSLKPDGTRDLFDTSDLNITAEQILQRVNAACQPPLPDLQCDRVELDNKSILIITIPPSRFVHETTRQLITGPGKTYTQCTVFIRHGEAIGPANGAERKALEQEKGQDKAEELVISVLSNTYRRAFSLNFTTRFVKYTEYVQVLRSIQDCHAFLQKNMYAVKKYCDTQTTQLAFKMLELVEQMESEFRQMEPYARDPHGCFDEADRLAGRPNGQLDGTGQPGLQKAFVEMEKVRIEFLLTTAELAKHFGCSLPPVPVTEVRAIACGATTTAEEPTETDLEQALAKLISRDRDRRR